MAENELAQVIAGLVDDIAIDGEGRIIFQNDHLADRLRVLAAPKKPKVPKQNSNCPNCNTVANCNPVNPAGCNPSGPTNVPGCNVLNCGGCKTK